jgi:hypothetical protein
MAAPTFLVNRDLARASHAAGTPRAALQAGRNRMVVKIALAVAALLAIAPAVATLAWPDGAGAAPQRSVELHGPILGFTQTQDRIQVRLIPARTEAEKDARGHIVIRGADGEEFASPLRRGQTWASIELPNDLASADQLDVSVE